MELIKKKKEKNLKPTVNSKIISGAKGNRYVYLILDNRLCC